MKVTFITGNANKAKYFSELIGMPVLHQNVIADEIQSLDLKEIAEKKALAAYQELKVPVIVEDAGFIIKSLGKLPGPLIKWFEQELGLEKICRLADISADRSAVVSAVFAYYDGNKMNIFKGELEGTVAPHPRGDDGYGWSPIFVPEGSDQSLGEMDDATFKSFYTKIRPFKELKEFLATLDKK